MEMLYERVAGLGISKASSTVCVRTPGPRGAPQRGSDLYHHDAGAGGHVGLAARAGRDDRGDGVDLDVQEGAVLPPEGGTGGLVRKQPPTAVTRQRHIRGSGSG